MFISSSRNSDGTLLFSLGKLEGVEFSQDFMILSLRSASLTLAKAMWLLELGTQSQWWEER